MDPTGIVVEPPDDEPGPSRRRRWIMVEVGAIVVAAAVGGWLGWRARGDGDQIASTPAASSSAMPTSPATVSDPPTTTEATSTGSTIAAASTTTTASTPTSSTTSTTTTSTTTTTLPPLATATDAALVAAMPGPGDVPSGWSPDPGGPEAGLDLEYGLGFCSGPTGDQRAVDNGAVAAASSYAEAPGPAFHELRLIGFATPDDAADYLTATRNQIDTCGAGITYRVPEGDGTVGTLDGFIDEDPPATWTITEAPRSSDVDVAGADDAVLVEYDENYAATLDGVAYGWSSTGGVQYERFGSIVVINIMSSDHDITGFDDAGEFDHVMSIDELMQAADHLRPSTLDGLRQQSLVR